MKLTVILILNILLFSLCSGSRKTTTLNHDCPKEYDSLVNMDVYTFVDMMPVLRNSDIDIHQFILINYNPPVTDEFQGSFLLEFVVDTTGKVIGPRVKNKNVKNITKSEEEMLRVLKIMPNWTPGKCNGEVVPVKISLTLKL